MNAPGTFTGRSRRRTTHPWVRASDLVARVVITAGGIGTIVAVLLVCVFLLATALPLFQRAWIEPVNNAVAGRPAAAAPGRLSHLGSDESGRIGFAMRPDGRIDVFEIATAASLLSRSSEETGLAGVSAVRVMPGNLDADITQVQEALREKNAVIGFEDGSHATARLGLRSSFVAAADVPAEVGRLGAGAAAAWQDTIFLKTGRNQYAKVELVAELDERRSPEAASPIVDVDITKTSSGPLLAVIAADGTATVESTSSKPNFMNDEIITTTVTGTIAAGETAGGTSAFVRVSELGDQVLLVAADGTARRYSIKRVDSPQLLETIDLTDGDTVTAVARLFGGTAVAIGDDAGGVQVWFTTRAARKDDTLTDDGSTLTLTKSFPPPEKPDPVSALAPSPRSRLFAAAHASGMVRLLHSTTRSVVATTSVAVGSGDPPPGPLAISSRDATLLAGRGGGFSAWRFEAGYPEVTLETLFGRIWYERYPEPVHAWETTGHESFEPKYGLVPLVFGTIKATIYSMLFAAPIAILAAIYSSQFMHPRWKARVKPAIEMMASLPSVVLGFVAGLVLAPAIESFLMTFLVAFVTVPLAIVAIAHLWMLLPWLQPKERSLGPLSALVGWIPAAIALVLPTERNALARWRFAAVLFGAIPAGIVAAICLAGPVERVLFGDLRAWLAGQGGSGFGGWVLLLMPISAVAVLVAMSRIVTPAIRRCSAGWSPSRAAIASLATFIFGAVATVLLAVAAAVLLDALRLDTRGGLVGTYVQRNALVVAIGMAFAIIPLIFTLADDALSSVPEHLRSASLGGGAPPWQTALRVTVPAAASGLFSAAMIGLGRAVGETMVVLMAAGNTPIIDWNVFNGFQTLSAAIATELPEAARGSAHYRILFLAALTLFAITFVVNTVAEFVRQRFRRRAHEL